MKKRLAIALLVTLGLSYLLMSIFGTLYSKFIFSIAGSFSVPDPANLTGFILSFLLFGSFFSWLLVENNKLKIWLFFISPFLLFTLFLLSYEELIIGIGCAIVGWLLAQGILFAKNKMPKKINKV